MIWSNSKRNSREHILVLKLIFLFVSRVQPILLFFASFPNKKYMWQVHIEPICKSLQLTKAWVGRDMN